MSNDKETICDYIPKGDDDDMPLGLEMSMVMHEQARENYMNLSKEQREIVETKAMAVNSKREMEELVEALERGEIFS